jgi:hypothetical protein
MLAQVLCPGGGDRNAAPNRQLLGPLFAGSVPAAARLAGRQAESYLAHLVPVLGAEQRPMNLNSAPR